ncbi:MAG: DNA-directed RNA polymerase [Nanoarchaeota archaeon]
MYYRTEIKDRIRVAPDLFGQPLKYGVIKTIKKQYTGLISKELGIVIDVAGVKSIGEGIIIRGDGAAYYETIFELLTFKPEMQEVLAGRVRDIADFGAFLDFGSVEGMIHISQTMDDFVSYSKDKVLIGKDTKRSLKVNDICKARIIALSFKESNHPKIGLTMRQPGLGKIEWLDEEETKEQKSEKK